MPCRAPDTRSAPTQCDCDHWDQVLSGHEPRGNQVAMQPPRQIGQSIQKSMSLPRWARGSARKSVMNRCGSPRFARSCGSSRRGPQGVCPRPSEVHSAPPPTAGRHPSQNSANTGLGSATASVANLKTAAFCPPTRYPLARRWPMQTHRAWWFDPLQRRASLLPTGHCWHSLLCAPGLPNLN